MALLFTADAPRAHIWREIFAAHLPDLDFRTLAEIGNPQDIRYLVGWQLERAVMARLSHLELLFSIGAGIDQLHLDLVPAHVPIIRMVEPGIQRGMVEYIVMMVLALHRDLFDYMAWQTAQKWQPVKTPPAAARRIGFLGLGDLGRRCAAALQPFGFPLSGWSRSPQSVEGVKSFHGPDALPAFLAQCDILICLLPLTQETQGILNAQTLAHLPQGAALINAARGGHVVNADLLAALERGHVSRAVLDVCTPEPLPAGDPLWNHPRVVLTPHVAGQTSLRESALAVIANLQRHWAGAALHGLVDRARGY